MKRITQLLIAVMLVGTASAQSSFIQKIKDKFSPSSAQNSAKSNPAQPQPGRNAAPAVTPIQPAAGPAVANKPAASKPAAGSPAAQGAAKAATSATAKPVVTNPGTRPAPANPTVKAAVSSTAAKPAKAAPTKISVAPIAPQPKQGAQKSGPFSRPVKKTNAKAQLAPKNTAKPAAQPAEAAAPAPEAKAKKMITAEGRRDPFLSPVVNSPSGPGCSTGKRCLAIDQIIVRGVVKSETGMIAVVVNAMNKAYFLKENDPVFNGYVMKITGDSVVFRETYQDKLGKEFTREVVKKLTTPAV
jgi:hypothetical protein